MSNKKLPSISHNEFAAHVRGLAAARIARKAADKAVRDAKAVEDLHRAKLMAAMNGNPSVVCGRATLTRKEGSTVPGALTLKTGGKVALADVIGIVVGQEVIPANDIKTWYGGRVSGPDIEIGGEV